MEDDEMTTDGHANANELASYLDGTLPRERADAVEEHLALCESCRADFVAAGRVLTKGSVPWSTWLLGAGLAAGLLFGLPSLWSRLGPGGASNLERASPPAATSVQVVSPPEGGTVPGGPITLVWRSVGSETQYRITVTDSAGGRLWSSESTDTVVTIAPTVTPKPGSYFWMVDALLADGRIRSSGTRRFETRP